ncbi:hypothetical protein [Diaphorobacter aerolatus]|uniref:PASTA domain-containing protein n=1 Tax=Diaphorobacter aerolatus TaxID=1288495 RepID=A0A7H0GKT1_9BURK|nr:hypothetical protein [Diaphorobacter aerolatus]QNP48897.1 hypothetical protein H9K75_01455 [Diaphorobacter aerolatus]
MNHRTGGYLLMATAICLAAPVCALAQAPGEDPIVLNKEVKVQMLPLNQNRTSNPIDYTNGIPAWQQAKLSRYTAKAFSADTTGIYTEKDVVQTVKTQGGKVTCAQSVGSTTAASATTGAAKGQVSPNGDQVVVLRGDMVNVCF